jgi:hypothetical protein
MAVNLKVAKTLGLAIPSSILLRADEHEFNILARFNKTRRRKASNNSKIWNPPGG